MSKVEIRLSGSGGQGIILAGIVVAKAAAEYAQKHSTQTQSYGPQARGGASKCEVILSENDIFYPKVLAPDILVSLTDEAAKTYAMDVKEDAILIFDDSVEVDKLKLGGSETVHTLPILSTATEKIGKLLTANMVTLGALSQLLTIVRAEDILKTILEHVPRGTEDMNTKAFEEGIILMKNSLNRI